MRTFRLCAALLLLSFVRAGAQPIWAPATQAEVNAGVLTAKFVSPATLRNVSGSSTTVTNASGQFTNLTVISNLTVMGVTFSNFNFLKTNFINLSVQAAKLPTTNYAFIDAGWQAWETLFFETNAEGIRTNLQAAWQFMVPPDYESNSLKLLLNYSLLNTNGPNTSNVIWGASLLSIRSGTTNNVHTNSFSSVVFGTNDWIAKYDGTNICTNLVFSLTNLVPSISALDLCVLKLERRAFDDTYGGAVSLHGIQLQYTRP